MATQDVVRTAESVEDLVESVANTLWENPEPSLEEEASANLLADHLSDAGFDVTMGVADLPTAFVAEYGTGEPVIATQCEYDALPGLSQARSADREPIEEGGHGHGCGHNLFGAASLGGAIALQRVYEREDLDGTIRVLGTPAEELGLGKAYMIHEGYYDDVDALITWHSAWLAMPDRGSTTALDKLEFEFSGVSSHPGMSPEAGRSAFDAVQLMNMGVEFMREHIPDSSRLHYSVQDTGGNDWGNAAVKYTIGAPDRAQAEKITSWVEDVAEGAATMTQTSVESDVRSSVYNVLPNQTLCDLIYENMELIGSVPFDEEDEAFASALQDDLDNETFESQMKKLGLDQDDREEVLSRAAYPHPIDPENTGNVAGYSTDTGNASWVTPTGRFLAPGWAVGTNAHSWQAVAASGTFGTKAAVYASKVVACSMYDLLTDEESLSRAKAEFDDQVAGRPYESPLDDDPAPPSDRV